MHIAWVTEEEELEVPALQDTCDTATITGWNDLHKGRAAVDGWKCL